MNARRGMLLVYIEPTPYILGLVAELRQLHAEPMRVLFLTENASQDWNLSVPEFCETAPAGMIEFIRRAWHVLGRRNVRLVHSGGWGGDARLSILLLMASARGIPLFVESDTQKPFRESSWKAWMKRLVYPALFRIPAGFLPGGARQAQYLRSFGVADSRIRVAQMTVDVQAILSFAAGFGIEQRTAWRSRLAIRPFETIVLFVGRLEPEKGIDPLLQAFERLAQASASIKLVLVGDGTLREEIHAQSMRSNWLIAPGRLTGAELLEAYCSSDIFVLPSRFEPWGLVVNEAMAAGLPVVASNRVGCVDDLIDGRDTGMTYEFASDDGVFNAVKALLDDPDARNRMGSNARRLISSWTLHAEAERVVGAWGSPA